MWFRKTFLAFIMIFGIASVATDGSAPRGNSPQANAIEVAKICTAEPTDHKERFGEAAGLRKDLVHAWVR